MKTQTRRPLGGFERFFWLLDQQRPVHFTMVAEITGTLPVTAWENALADVQQLHPLLSVSINLNENNSPEFVSQPGATIPLRIVKATSETEWVADLEHEAINRFHAASAPLIRAVLYEYQNKSVIALIAHHSIADGRSLSFVIRDLLNATNGKHAEPYAMPPSLDDYTDLPKNTLSQFPASDADVALFSQQPQAVKTTPQIQLLQLSPELSSQVIKRSKQEGTTVQGALMAALALAGKAWKSQPIRLFSPSSARETLGAGETICLSIGGGRIVPFDMERISDFWDIARYAKESLAGVSSKEEIFGFAKAVFGLITSGINAEGTVQFADTALANEYMITNVGALPFESTIGKLKLDAVWGPITITGYECSQTVGITSINGSINMALTSPSHMQVKPVLEFMEQILSMECIPLNSLSQEQSF
ncbi:condensation domain-containing protein [Mucilaginibacter sp. McL0603]|uniref:condensation domain-containing protein n=1 Tax=Mucilaginibacter sp. McL0603 TaxID=3415670 RepID=UPI003CF881D1